MSDNLNISIAQINFTVGDIENNLQKIISIYKQITQTGNLIIPDLLVFPELAISGYPAEDLYIQPNFQNHILEATEVLKKETFNKPCAILIGSIKVINHKLLNVAYLIKNGEIIHLVSKSNFPNYGVFDELRYFSPDEKKDIFELKGYKISTIICEDLWKQDNNKLLGEETQILIAINASPFNLHKDALRKDLAKRISLKNKVDLVYLNQIGAQDELLFDGGSFVTSAAGEVIVQLSYFEESIFNITWKNGQIITSQKATLLSKEELLYQGLKLALKDYTSKNNFTKVLIGLSGGIDSALTAAIAADALGAEHVVAVKLPSKYSSISSSIDALTLSKELRIELLDISIEPLVETIRKTLDQHINFKEATITDQNIQARARGILLMALSNQYGYLLLSTGNKSENAVGYTTLYGDMCGGYNLLKDLYKTQVYALSKWRNLPKSIIEKAPSAELHPNQKDQDFLPDYETLDKILFHFIEENLSISQVCDRGYPLEIVKKIFLLLKSSEYKRRQSCPGPIVSTCSLSKDRRYPITNHFMNN